MACIWNDPELWKEYSPALDITLGDRLRFDLGEGQLLEVELPEPVRVFLATFNRGEHP